MLSSLGSSGFESRATEVAMAEDLDDWEFCLPSQFLTEEDILTDFDISTPTTESTNGFSSDLGSPVDSVTETESDEEELLAELTRQMALSSLVPDAVTTNSKGWVLSGPPQSTLCLLGGVRGGSSRGSPTAPVSPPAKGDYFKVCDGASFDLLHAAAGEVAKMRMRTDQQQKGTGYFDSNRALLFQQRKQSNPNFHGFLPRQTELSHHQLQAFPFQEMWSQETMKQQRKIGGEEFIRCGRSDNLHQGRPLCLSPSAWPPLQHPSKRQVHPPSSAQNPPGSGMRAVFLGVSGAKRESVGTGVFLPRRLNPTESRQNSNKHDSNGRFRGHNNGHHHGHRRRNDNARPQSGANTEIQLPSEWTY